MRLPRLWREATGCEASTLIQNFKQRTRHRKRVQTCGRALAPECARGLKQILVPRKQRAQGKPGAQHTRSLACKMKKAHEQVTTGPPKRSGLPCAMVYGLFWALLGVHDLVVTVARAMRKHCCELGTSQGVPGPHSFAVRNHAARLAALLRPPHPRLTCRDDRDTPLCKRSGMHHPYI